jgi:hypothetical protein
VQFEAEKPAHRTLAPFGDVLKNPVAADPLVFANRDAGGIDKGDAVAFPPTTMQVTTQRQQYPGHQFDKSVVTDQTGKFIPQVFADIFSVVGLEIPVMGLMEMDNDRYYFTDR